MKCPTTAGTYRCKHDVGHTGDCEADSPEYGTSLEKRVAVLEAQVRSLQMAAPRGIE